MTRRPPAAIPPTIRIQARFWRMLAPRWAHAPLSGAGAAKQGGRWNPPGTPALYMSEAFTTAVAEYEQDLGIRPGTLCAYEVDAERIVDLTDSDARAALRVDTAVLTAPWKQIALVDRARPPSWDLADRLIRLGLAGARVPSVRSAGANVVLWTWNGGTGARVTALDPLGDLPRSQASWT